MKTKTVFIFLFLVLTSILRGDAPRFSPQGVDLVTGLYVEMNDDITLGGALPLTLRRLFGSSLETQYVLGGGWQWQLSTPQQELYQLDVVSVSGTLKKLALSSKMTGRLLGELQFEYSACGFTVSDSRGRKWLFSFNQQGELERSESPSGSLQYTYAEGQIVTRTTKEGHFSQNELYMAGNNSVGGETLYLLPDDFRIGRVKTQKAVMQEGESPQVIAEYLYSQNETTLLEPNGKRSTFSYNEKGEITQISTAISTEHYVFEKGRVIQYQLQDEKGTKLLEKEFVYSDEGFLVRETLRGSLTGDAAWEEYTVTSLFSNGLLCRQEDNAGNWTTYEYDGTTSLLIAKETPAGKTSFAYNEEGLPLVIEEEKSTTLLTYNELNEVVQKEVAGVGSLQITSRTFDACGREIFHDISGKEVVATSYSPGAFSQINYTTGEESVSTLNFQNRVVHKKLTKANGQILEQQITYDLQGNVVASRDVVGNTTEYVWDSYGRLVEKIDPPVLNANDELYRPRTSYSYNALHHLKSIDYPDGTKARYSTNCRGQPLIIYNADGTQQTFSYTLDGKRRGETNAPLKLTVTTDQETGEITHTHKLKKGSLKTTWSEEGRVTRDEKGHLLVKEDKKCVEEFSYEGGILKKIEMQESGLQLISTYDALGRVEKLTLQDGGQNILSYREFRYDAMGRTVKRVDNGCIETRWVYDARGDLIQTIDYASANEPRITTFSYNANHQLTQLIKPDGVSLDYSYNERGQITSLTSSDGTVNDEYIYNDEGKVVVMIDHSHERTVERSYNQNGQLTNETQSFGHTLSYRYDSDGKRVELLLPDHSFVRYEYDGARLKRILRPTYEESFNRYDERGYPSLRTLPANLGTLKTERNSDGSIASIESPYWEERIEYKGGVLSNIKFQTKRGVESHQLSFDALGRITKDNNNSFTFDAESNLQRLGDKQFTTDEKHQLLSDGKTSYQYDKNGNRIAKGDTRYAYDALNRLTDVFTPEHHLHYEYDPLGRRVVAATDGKEEIFFYDQEKEIGCEQADGVQTLRILSPAELSNTIAIEVGGELFVPIHDHRGTICCLVDAKTKSVAEYSVYDPFGEEKLFSGGGKVLERSKQPWHFSGKRKDPLTGLVHFGKRDYDPETGRFIARDPIGSFEGPNPYAYGLNNPIQYVDLNGLYSISTITESLQNVFSDYLGTILNQIEILGHNLFGGTFLHLLGVYPNPARIGVFGNGTEPDELYRVSFINGVLSTKEDIAFNLSLISSHHGGHNVHYFYIGTEGWMRDAVRCFETKLGIYTEGVDELVTLWRRLIDEMGGPERGGVIYHYAHSLGGTITQDARYFLTPEEQKMIRVVTMGSPTLIPDEGFDSVINIVSHGDLVTRAALLNRFFLGNIHWVGDFWQTEHFFGDYWDHWQVIRSQLHDWTHEWKL